jgi:hypothetical protein
VIGLVFALKFEAKYFNKNDNISKSKFCILNTVGKRIGAEMQFLISKNNLQCIVLMGFAGGMNEFLSVGDVVLVSNYTSNQFLPHFQSIAGSHKVVNLVTVDHVLETRSEKEHCRRESGAECCDMETAHVWKIAHQFEIPMITVRCISDALTSDMPIPGNILIDPRTSRPNALRLLGYLSSHPTRIQGFIQMVRHASHAAQRLATVAQDEFLPQIESLLRE